MVFIKRKAQKSKWNPVFWFVSNLILLFRLDACAHCMSHQIKFHSFVGFSGFSFFPWFSVHFGFFFSFATFYSLFASIFLFFRIFFSSISFLRWRTEKKTIFILYLCCCCRFWFFSPIHRSSQPCFLSSLFCFVAIAIAVCCSFS